MGFSTFLVVLEPERPVYIAGQDVSGYVLVRSHEEVACRNIKVTIKGQAKVHWSQKSGKSRRHYRSEELYFRHPIIVWNGEGTGNSMRSGDHRFPFSFILPADIPSSFTSQFGNVAYQVKAEADRPWAMDQSHKLFFSVNFMYDLNRDPLSVVPLRLQKQKTVCCCCCAQGPIVLDVTAQRSGYVPGESIMLDGEVINHSSSTIKHMEIKLVQSITFITKTKLRMIERTVQRVYRPQVQGGRKDTWASVPLPIPGVPASHLRHCNIITISYDFVLIAKLGTCRKAKAKVPVIIGSLPLHTTYSSFLPPNGTASVGGTTATATVSNTHHNTSHPPTPPPHGPFAFFHPPSAPSMEPYSGPPPMEPYSGPPPPYNASFLPPQYCDVPPPSYAECAFRGMTGKGAAAYNDDADDSDAGEYAPRYLTYKTHS